MRRYFSFGLQLLGLLIVAQALVIGVMAEVNPMAKELTILTLGAVVFMIGHWLQPES
ncbi:MAG: hypothetical protein ABEK50_07205 [bacterium]